MLQSASLITRLSLGTITLVIAASLAAIPAAACACCDTWQVTGVSEDDVLNMRSGPSHRFSRVGAIPARTACVIKSNTCEKNWCLVSYAGTDGWVNTKYLRFFHSP